MARISINGQASSASFVVLRYYSTDVILGIGFLNQHGAVIDLRSHSTTLCADNAISQEWKIGHHALNVVEEQVTVPPLSSVIIFVGTEEPVDHKSVIEGDQHLLLNRYICIARDIAELSDRKAKVILTNFSHEYSHLNVDTTVAFMYEFVDASNVSALFNATEPASTNRGPQADCNIHPGPPKHKQYQLKTLLLEFKEPATVV